MKQTMDKIDTTNIPSGTRFMQKVLGEIEEPMEGHPSEVQLLKFAGDARTLSSVEFHALEAHFSVCEPCLSRLEEKVTMLDQARDIFKDPLKEFLKKVEGFVAKVLWESRLAVQYADVGAKSLTSDDGMHVVVIRELHQGQVELVFRSSNPGLLGQPFSFTIGAKTYSSVVVRQDFKSRFEARVVIRKDEIDLSSVQDILARRKE